MSELLSVKFTASNAVRGKRPYTIYEIEVRSSTTMPWLLYKRYRDFDNLHAQLQKLIAQNKQFESLNIKLNLPPKRLVRSMAPDVVAKRQKELEQYLQSLLSNTTLVRNQLILDFLTVPESLRAMLMRRKANDNVLGDIRNFGGIGGIKRDGARESSSSYSFSTSPEEREVNLLLKELSLQKNRVRALSKFEKWYFESSETPNMRPDLIKKLMTGDETHQGLVHSCRLLHSKVAWRASISLLVRCLDIERNKYARIFQEVFLTLQQGLYKEMDLHRHINDTSQEDGFKIVQLIYNNLPSLDPKFYVPDEDAMKQFEKWLKIQNDSFGVGNNGKKDYDDDNGINIVGNNFIYNWKEMEYKEISELAFSSFRELSSEPDDEYQKVPISINNNTLKVRYRKDIYSQEWKLKITFAVDHPPQVVYNFLLSQQIKLEIATEMDIIKGWNTKIVKQKTQKRLDNNHYVVHQTYKSFNSPYKFNDFVLLTCLKSDAKSKRYMIVFSSISNYDDIPEQSKNSNVKRAILLPSGFEIRPTKENINRSHVSYRAHMTNQSVLTVSADLLGETDELFKSMLRIEQLITKQIATQ